MKNLISYFRVLNNGENKNYSNPLRFNTLDSFKILLIKYGDIKYKKNLLYL